MGIEAAAPTTRSDRIGEVDIIRGFALFGVLWMNLLLHDFLVIPEARLEALPTASVDNYMTHLSLWLLSGKAQALFSILFGFGFAILTDRAAARGANATALYFRRVGILLAVGLAHLWLLWLGDILHAYALMGFLLLFTRRWPGRLMLALGLALAILSFPALSIWSGWGLPPGQQPALVAAEQAGIARRWVIFQGSDYTAFVTELVRSSWLEVYSQALGVAGLAWIFGRFLIGAWIFRQGWMQDTSRYAAGFRRWAGILLGLGLAFAAIRPLLHFLEIRPSPWQDHALQLSSGMGQLVLALGYAAALVVLCQKPQWRRRLSGLGSVGQMALTNYLMQSLVYFFVLYGFGLGLLPYAGATFCSALALVAFGGQVLFSRWWLARYRFGPAEWAWRSLTYGERQPMRLNPAVAAPSAPRPLP